MIGRVVEIYGPRVELMADDRLIDAVATGKLKHGSRETSLLAVGDYVEFTEPPNKQATIDRILKRKSTISRPAVDREGVIQVIVSNIDRLVIVGSVTSPDFKPNLVDRFLVIAFKEQLHPVIIINKIDLTDPAPYREHIAAWRNIDCSVICTSAVTGAGIDELSSLLAHGTSVITGHSGVGKSSLLNRINPGLNIKTGVVSKYSGKGVHTTSRVSLFQLFPDGWVADTPGLKDLGLANVTQKNLYRYFPEFERFEANCQFSNCVHVEEPDCAIKKAIQNHSPDISASRYQSYLNIFKTVKKDKIEY